VKTAKKAQFYVPGKVTGKLPFLFGKPRPVLVYCSCSWGQFPL